MKRKEYCALFDTRVRTDPYTGRDRRETVYVGPYYTLDVDGRARKRAGGALAAIWAACVCVFVVCGLTNANGSRCFYVLPVYLLLRWPLFYMGMAVFRILRMAERFTAVDRDEGIERARRCAGAMAVLCTLHTLGDAVLMILGGGKPGVEAFYLAGIALMGMGGIAALRLLRRLMPREQKEAGAAREAQPGPKPG